MFNAERYLAILGVEKEEPSLQFLRRVHYAHLLQFPFENLDIHRKEPILLDIDRISVKLLENRRGGFCYELNGLFYNLLTQLGFDAYMIQAQVWFENKWGPKYDHLAIAVTIGDDLYLADVGFGECFLYPKKINDASWQVDGNNFYRVRKDNELFFLERSKDMLSAEDQYKFDLTKRQYIEFLGMCEFMQNDPTSHFRKNKIITKITPTGRITLKDDALIVTEKGEKERQEIRNDFEFNSELEKHFGIKF